MTKDQKLLRYYVALKEITNYMDPEKLRAKSEAMYGVSGNEGIEMAYENVLETARQAIRGHRLPLNPAAKKETK